MQQRWRVAISLLVALGCTATAWAKPTPNEIASLLNSVKQYADLGDTQNAIILMREWRQKRPDFAPTVEFQLQYAKLLFATGQDVEAASVMRTLRGLPLTTEQQGLYAKLQLDETVFNANQLRQQGRLAAAYDTLAPVLAQTPDNARALQSLGDMYMSANQPAAALDVFQQALVSNPSDASVGISAANAALAADNKNYAETALKRAVDNATAQGNMGALQQAAQLYQRMGQANQAAAVQAQINQLRGLTQAAPPPTPGLAVAGTSGAGYINPFSHLEGPASDRTVPADAAHYVAPLPTASATLAAAPVSNRQAAPIAGLPPLNVGTRAAVGVQASSLQQEYDAIMSERSPQIQGGVYVSGRDGDSGTSKMTKIEEPIIAQFPAGEGAVQLRVIPTQVFAGSLDGTSFEGATFGSGPMGSLLESDGVRGGPGAQKATGVGLSAAYLSRHVDVDVGVTPLGFRYKTFTGGLRLKGAFDDAQTAQFYANLSRRPVVDSLLSFAGTRDERYDLSWGGVSASGLRLGLSKDFDGTGIYSDLSWHYLDGNHVKKNQRWGFNLGMYHHFINEPDQMLTGGINLNGMFYQNNLRYFTYGHGGYFSPQHYFGLNFPVTWAQSGSNYSYYVSGSLGVSQFRESSADMFPLDSGAQRYAASWIAAANRNDMGDVSSGRYPGQTKTTFNYNLNAALEYRLTPQFALGTSIGLDNSRDYSQWAGGFFLRYYFYPQKQSPLLPTREQGPYYNQASTYGGR